MTTSSPFRLRVGAARGFMLAEHERLLYCKHCKAALEITYVRANMSLERSINRMNARLARFAREHARCRPGAMRVTLTAPGREY